MLTIKDVLEKFAAQPLNSAIVGRQRTINGDCPLQVVTGEKIYYRSTALSMGLSYEDSSVIIHWADTGRWCI